MEPGRGGGWIRFSAGLTRVETRGGTVTEQKKFQRIDHHLAEAGTSKAKLVSAQIWLTDASATFNKFNVV